MVGAKKENKCNPAENAHNTSCKQSAILYANLTIQIQISLMLLVHKFLYIPNIGC